MDYPTREPRPEFLQKNLYWLQLLHPQTPLQRHVQSLQIVQVARDRSCGSGGGARGAGTTRYTARGQGGTSWERPSRALFKKVHSLVPRARLPSLRETSHP
ncbi:unnamed protein product [Ixodes pacificus]